MSGYIGSTPVPQATQHRESFTCTEGQTTFNTAGYTAQFVDVYLNGSHLSPADFTATNGSDVVLGVAASADDVCDIISYTPFEVADATFTGTTTLDGAVVINESSADVDFRVESNGNANMLFVDGGNDRLQIGSAATDDDQMFQLILAGGSAGFGIHSNRAAAGGSALILSHNRNASVGSFTILQDDDSLGRITFQGCDGGDIKTEGAQISAEVDGTPGANDMPTRLVFSTTADGANSITEAMRIDASQRVLISTTTNQGAGFTFSSSQLNCVAPNANSVQIVQFRNSNGKVGTITVADSSTAYATSSDHRLKENVDYSWDATTRLKQLKPARFNFISDDTNTLVDGFIAHEVSSIVPEAVTGAKDAMVDEEYIVTPAVKNSKGQEVKSAVMGTRSVPDMQGIDQSKLVPLLVKTILELEARITALEG